MSCGCRSETAPAIDDTGGCSAGESFALQVLGDEMLPEFAHGEIVIIEPDGALRHGCFVLAQHEGEWLLRQLLQQPDGSWLLHALNSGRADLPDLPDLHLAGLHAVHGVVIQKAVPGRRRASKFYL